MTFVESEITRKNKCLESSSTDSVTALGSHLSGVEHSSFTSWRWQMKHQVTNYEELSKLWTLSEKEKVGFTESQKIFKVGITPYYASLIPYLKKRGGDHKKIELQAIPRQEEWQDRQGLADPIREVDSSPVPEVVHLYPDRVAFCVAMLCPVYCRYCFRKRRDKEVGLHFNRRIIDRGIQYISSNPSIKDVLITGGDPLIASDESLEALIKKLRSIPHVDIIRIGTRTPVTLPYRITPAFSKMLAKYHPVWLNTHFNCYEEITEEAKEALKNLANEGIPVGNQSVFLKGVNDTVEDMKSLCWELVKNRVRPYYVFHGDQIEGTSHLRVSIKKGLQIMKALRGNISGYAIPTYALDTPSGKVPLHHNHILNIEGEDLIIENLRGEIWREKNAFPKDS